MKASQLQEFQDCVVVLALTDGEVLKAKVSFVDIEYEDIIVDVLETNRPEHYKNHNSAYAVKAADIASAEKASILGSAKP